MTARILVFGRAPEPGTAKTRLIPATGAVGAARLYQVLLERTLSTAAQLPRATVEFWHTDPDDGRCAALAARYGAAANVQQGADLGERMYNALASNATKGMAKILIGSDVPDYSADYLAAAIACLGQNDAVIGPANDGGYVLIGLRTPRRRLFSDIEWSSGRVLDTTRTRLRSLRYRWHELPALHDVDTPADLARYPDLWKIAKPLNR